MFSISSTPSSPSPNRLAALLVILAVLSAPLSAALPDYRGEQFRAYGSTVDATEYSELDEAALTFANSTATAVLSWDAANLRLDLDQGLEMDGALSIGGTVVLDASRNLGNISNSTGTTNVVFSDTPTLLTPNWTGTATGVGLTLSGNLSVVDITASGDIDFANDTGTGDYVRATNPALNGTAQTSFTLDSDNAGAGAASIALAFNRGTDGSDAGLVWNETSDRFEFKVSGAGTALDLWMGNLHAVDGTFSGDLDCDNATGTGDFVRATSPTLVTPALGAATATTVDASGDVEADSFSINGTTVIYDDLSAAFGEVSATQVDSSGSISGTNGTFTGNLTLSSDVLMGTTQKIIFDADEDSDTYIYGDGDTVVMLAAGQWIGTLYSFAYRWTKPHHASSRGSAATPMYSYWDDSNTGEYSSAADHVDFATGGTRAGGFDSSQNFDAVGTITVQGGATIRSGTGSPESVVTGNVGDLFLRTDGGASTTLYVKESGSATNTGWVAK